ncbi:hypothetical protein HID58_037923 [Brassica napus]|uniref:Uncharacterized protein n=1 Tax=Brassica napus TaxID=3708 RepID=A0ABQ8BPI2_BRANA|nr:hypothetical protein HID58_037923 [Brassica napus]
MHQARETTGENPSLSLEVQSLKEKLDEHSKQLEQSTEKLSRLHSENTVLRDQNQALNATGNKNRRFNTRGQLGKGQIILKFTTWKRGIRARTRERST